MLAAKRRTGIRTPPATNCRAIERPITVVANIYLLTFVLVLLATKHVVFDFFLQTLYQRKNKGIYGHPGGLLHSAGHALGTGCIFLVIRPSLLVAVSIILGEFVVHYHIDWCKEQIGDRMKWGPQQNAYWRAMGIDQWLHQLTYVGIALVLAMM